ncbi:hypothetical protein BV898_07375 [Hypsibius exemplaris]|uniref:ALMS motif domain-containing protein n=1 Tax=Hypsibius exemplaris TaxID=2072580 RepID=A0A1W0WTL3_HYPEX|nr:hypothetical protein BV898_07375 [Hypsibius exemplaris]
MEETSLDAAESLVSYPPHSPTQFDLMFQEVQDRMHRLFERYAELKRDKRARRTESARSVLPDSHYASPRSPIVSCHSAITSEQRNDSQTNGEPCENPACSCRESPCSYRSEAMKHASPTHSASENGRSSPSEPTREAADNHACPYSSGSSSVVAEPVKPYDPNDYCTVCETLQLQTQLRKLPIPEPSTDSGSMFCQFRKQAPRSPCKVPWNSEIFPPASEVLTDEPTVDGCPEQRCDFTDEDSSRRRALGYQLTWMTPEKVTVTGGSGRCRYWTDDAAVSGGSGGGGLQTETGESIEISCLPKDTKCMSQPEPPLDLTEKTQAELFRGTEKKDVPFMGQPPISLQEAFCCRKRKFLERSWQRQEQIQAKHADRMLSNWTECIPLTRRKRSLLNGSGSRLPHDVRNGNSYRSNLRGYGDECFEQRQQKRCIPRDNVISLKTAREETNRRLLQMQTKKQKSAACLLEEARVRRYRLVAYSRMVRNRNHYLYERNVCC